MIKLRTKLRTAAWKLFHEPSSNPRRDLRNWYAVMTIIFTVDSIVSYGSWLWMLGFFVLAVWFAAGVRAEHRAMKADEAAAADRGRAHP